MAFYRTLRYNPNRDLITFQDSMDSLVSALLNNAPGASTNDSMSISPKLDMKETKDSIFVNLAMPGIKPEDIDISVNDGVLTIKGESKENKEEKPDKEEKKEEGNWLIKEQSEYSYYREITLPTNVVAEKAKASYKNGMLNLELPKAEEVKPKSIAVKIDDESRK